MKLLVITDGDDPKMREAIELADVIENEGYEVQRMEWENDETSSLAALYDIYSTPAFVVVQEDGKQVELWQGEEIPLAANIKHLM